MIVIPVHSPIYVDGRFPIDPVTLEAVAICTVTKAVSWHLTAGGLKNVVVGPHCQSSRENVQDLGTRRPGAIRTDTQDTGKRGLVVAVAADLY